jgi:anion-transporting  ArsA/GET3 family ATPase
LSQLFARRRVLLCVGCGGVGKTTTCAALGLAAAQRGKRVLCLTIDPARRLAQSLGLERVRTEAQHVDPAVLRDAGLQVSGTLTVMMLDTKRTFDELIASLADTPDKRDGVLDNLLYQYISTSLAGTQEYMAMEKLYAVKNDPAYDLVILDTPPTSHALDFLDAPERLIDAIDSAAVRWFLKAFQKSGTLSINLLQRSAAMVLRALARITGAGFLDQVAAFVTVMNDLFSGWRERAEEVRSALRGTDIGYVLVTSPEPMAIREVLFFAERLREQEMRADAYVVNRVHPLPQSNATTAEVDAALARRSIDLGPDGPERVLAAAADERRHGELDRLNLVALEEAFGDERGPDGPKLVHVPEFPLDILSVRRLAWVADVLAPR